MRKGLKLVVAGLAGVSFLLSVTVGTIYRLGRRHRSVGSRPPGQEPPEPVEDAADEASLAHIAAAVAAMHHRRRRAHLRSRSSLPDRST